MTTLASVPPITAAAPAPAAEPPARFGDLLASEWIKTRSLRSTPWTLAFVMLFVIGSSAAASLAEYYNIGKISPDARTDQGFLVFDAYSPAGYMTLMLVAGSIGALAVVSEYGSGLIRTTTVAVPARGSVVLAKAAVVAAVWTVVGTVISIGSFTVSQAILNGRHAGVSFSQHGVLRAVVASALLAPVCAVIGVGLGVLIRHSAATMTTTAFTLLMLQPMFSDSKRWSADVNHMMVVTAWKRLLEYWEPGPDRLGYTATVPGSWIVLALWPFVAIVLALVVVRRRDV
ncbi:ABC transporter permease [Kitasatospora sp. GP82]|uniref:ABC transporter permease n=1 Tax=Kitasatospora sp. GP82 TaxID=3035089 RepID=UPI002473C5B6|nr:ABC transporter permease [Kitasatospora sp. GP82]MDH6124930.1 ABC-2 type transport system permease protein [Kitasatospora sp. GP82]